MALVARYTGSSSSGSISLSRSRVLDVFIEVDFVVTALAERPEVPLLIFRSEAVSGGPMCRLSGSSRRGVVVPDGDGLSFGVSRVKWH